MCLKDETLQMLKNINVLILEQNQSSSFDLSVTNFG